jgi:hypothetical protein
MPVIMIHGTMLQQRSLLRRAGKYLSTQKRRPSDAWAAYHSHQLAIELGL